MIAFQRCVQLDPSNAGAQYLLGVTYVKLGNKDAALEVYYKLQTLDKGQAQQLYDVINDKQPESKPATSTAAPPNTPSSEPNANTPLARQLIVLGSLQQSSGKSDEALKSFSRAIALNPDAGTLAVAQLDLGSLYIDLKQ